MEQDMGKGKQLQDDTRPSGEGKLEKEGEPKIGDATKDISEDGREDFGPYFEDLLSPGGEHLHFGTWKPMDIQKIARMQVIEEKSVAFNEYGSNLIKYKFDPLTVIEAKFAMAHEKDCSKGDA
jgi:hypothetical protein